LSYPTAQSVALVKTTGSTKGAEPVV